VHWLSNLWFNYFWSSDKGNGPEAIQQTALYAALATVFVPVIRHWAEAHVKAFHEKLDLVHQKMDHIIEHHPDIPAFVPKEKE
jgi:hypothetical protein